MTERLFPALLAVLLFTGCGGGSSEAPQANDDSKTDSSNKAEQTLHAAAEAGDLAAVEKHLATGIDVNARADDKSTALHFAAQEGHVEVAKRLIEAGADISAKDDIDQTPGDRARFWKKEAIVELLESSSIHEAAREGDLKTVLQQLNAGKDVNQANDSGDTPLTYAAFMGHLEIVDLLIEKNANVNAKGLAGWTPLHLAAQRGHQKIVEQLIAKGAEINALTDEGFGGTPLDVANDALAEFIRENGGKPAAELDD